MTNIRNDINHAGWEKAPAAIEKFKGNLASYIEKAERLFRKVAPKGRAGKIRPEKNLFLIFSHELTVRQRQRQEAEERLGIGNFLGPAGSLASK